MCRRDEIPGGCVWDQHLETDAAVSPSGPTIRRLPRSACPSCWVTATWRTRRSLLMMTTPQVRAKHWYLTVESQILTLTWSESQILLIAVIQLCRYKCAAAVSHLKARPGSLCGHLGPQMLTLALSLSLSGVTSEQTSTIATEDVDELE